MNLEAQARMMENGKRFVWWSTPESRAAGRISVLAIAETFFAVALYWWIAFHFDTHLHLVTSLLVAPLLLLRSEKSIEVGVDWFLRDWFDFEHYEEWSRVRKAMWLGVPALPAFAGSWWAGSHLAHAWLPDQTGLALFLAAASIGVTGGLLGLVIGIAVAGAGAGTGTGYAARAITIRLAATLRFLVPDGIKSLPDNWRENNFVIDTMTPSELVPGIGKRNESLTLNGVINRLKEADIALKFAFFLFIPIWFIPVFFYRLNIKATCWFYWPLAFLLRPLPTDDRMERRQRDLCWPWTNPAQLSLIIGSGALGLFAVFASLIEIESLLGFAGWSGVPFWLEYLFILDWSRLEPWHWANLSIAVTGIAMLLIAGNAVAAYKAGLDYGQETPWSLPAMHLLWRLRTLAVVATLMLAMGSVVVHLQPGWLDYLPARQAQAVAEFMDNRTEIDSTRRMR